MEKEKRFTYYLTNDLFIKLKMISALEEESISKTITKYILIGLEDSKKLECPTNDLEG